MTAQTERSAPSAASTASGTRHARSDTKIATPAQIANQIAVVGCTANASNRIVNAAAARPRRYAAMAHAPRANAIIRGWKYDSREFAPVCVMRWRSVIRAASIATPNHV